MKKLLLALIFFPALVFAQDFEARYVRNYDGDTITVNLNCNEPLFCNKMSIRVNGIDTPEIKKTCRKEKLLGKKAKYYVNKKIKKSDLKLKNCKKGKFFRLVCDVYYNDILLSQKLIEQKLAVEYDGRKKTKNWCN